MPVEQVYVLEMIVKKIELEEGIRINDINGLTISFKFAHIMNFDIDTAHFDTPRIEENTGEKIIKMNYGKSFLFVAKPSILRQLLQSDPYQITLYDGNDTVGSTSVPWKKEFPEMVKFFESLGIVKSTTLEDNYNLYNAKRILTAKVEIFLRLSCFGQNLHTTFQIRTTDSKQEYLFRQRNSSKTFMVEKHADERCQPIVAPLYTGIADAKDKPTSVINMKENVSLTQLFERETVHQKDSAYQSPETPNGEEGLKNALQDDFDKVSICFRPSENKFFDLLNIISADVKTDHRRTEVTIHRKKVSRLNSFFKSVGGDLRQSPNIYIDDDDEDVTEMTADKIGKKLCGNKDCPAVKKFKEYGIGPLATGKGLGTVYGNVEPPVTYGISHTYGTMCEYGPYGVFSRPKQEELPFVPRTEGDDLPSPPKPCKMNRDESNDKCSKKKKKKAPEWHSQSCPLYPDRLRGGADDTALIGQDPNDDGTVMPKSPIIECKGVMEQFDNILAEYKKAVGPCGHATCPYAQTLAEDTCKKMCGHLMPPAKQASSMSCQDVPCDVDGCPYTDDPKKKSSRYPAGCGSPKCAYTKYKLGLLDDDAELELRFLPPALGNNCGDPHCKYPLAPALPPIHWECPDPLPKGPCRNLNCPFQPRPLKKFITKKQLKTGPCGSPMCPYALPQACGYATCPFAMVPCPMVQEQKPKKENRCENPDCPFAQSNADKGIADEVDDPKFRGEFQDCVNPECPYKKPDKRKKKSKKKTGITCGNPACASIVHKKKKNKGKGDQNSSGICSNPECPDRVKDISSICSNADCPDRAEDSASVCSNPECPDRMNANNKKKSSCQQGSSSETSGVCSDPECPFANKKNKPKEGKPVEDKASSDSCSKRDDDSLCSNPNCPERATREKDDQDICTVPGCPYSKKPPTSTICIDPTCPYLKPLPSCGIPNCPYEPIPLGFSSKNPKCPSKALDFGKKIALTKRGTAGERLEHGQEKRVVSEHLEVDAKVPKVCQDDAPCDETIECDNPECMDENRLGQKASHSKRKRKRRKKGKFVYSMGDTYPLTKLGHKECVTPIFNVPPHMGWLWNIFTPILNLKPRRGWRPGALTKTIAARIRAHRQSKGLGYLTVPTFKHDGKQYDEGDPKVVPKPTLQIQKKDGTYWITMNPLKDPHTLAENEDPYMECTPMTFKITKNKTRQDDLCYCDCDEAPGDVASSSSSDSELDIEFTPPAGIIHPERFKKRPNVVCCEAQYDSKDFEVAKRKDNKKLKGDQKGGKKGDKKGKGGKKKK